MEGKKINWHEVKVGTFFKCVINDTKCIGRVQKDEENDVLFCQNRMDGAYIANKFGYRYSWLVEKDKPLISSAITELELSDEPFEGMEVPLVPVIIEISNDCEAKITHLGITVDGEFTPYDKVKLTVAELAKHTLYNAELVKDLDSIRYPEVKWSKIKSGTWFGAIFRDKFCVGKIQKEGEHTYLCQDIADGKDAEDKFGFKYSWTISDGRVMLLKDNDIRNLTFFDEKPDVNEITIPNGNNVLIDTLNDYPVFFDNGTIRVGCQKYSLAMGEKVMKIMDDLIAKETETNTKEA